MKIAMLKNYLISIFLVLSQVLFFSCDSDEVISDPPRFQKVTVIDDFDSVISSGDMGDWIAIKGENLESTNAIFFNDISVDMEEIYYDNDILYLQIPIAMPLDINNKLKVVTESGEFDLDFTVNIPNIKLTGMFNEYTLPGDTMKMYGDFFELYEVDSSNTVIVFDGIESPVIQSGEKYLTVRVPENAGQNIKLKIVNKTFNASAECPGYYQDRQFMITNFDDIPYTGADGAHFVGLWSNPKPISGNYSLVTVGPEGSGWMYMLDTGVSYTDDMKDNPEKYEVKFELNMITPIMKTKFFVYNYWNHPPGELTASDLAVQNPGIWETVKIPLQKIIPTDFSGNKDYIGSFNVRVESPAGEPVKMGFDNFRITLKE